MARDALFLGSAPNTVYDSLRIFPSGLGRANNASLITSVYFLMNELSDLCLLYTSSPPFSLFPVSVVMFVQKNVFLSRVYVQYNSKRDSPATIPLAI